MKGQADDMLGTNVSDWMPGYVYPDSSRILSIAQVSDYEQNEKEGVLTCLAQLESDMFKLTCTLVGDTVTCDGASLFLGGMAMTDPPDTSEPGGQRTTDHNLSLLKYLSTEHSSLESRVEGKRLAPSCDMHSLRMGEEVFWSERDEHFGHRRVIVGASDHHDSQSVTQRCFLAES